ncbi:ABC transporter permease [Jatrophihabitans sp.]|uniref:ABC transporter permease n=1 Tax=Jatrophihabitans sp. TaxID=1932789 RepID=UPI0030C6CE6E|nr:transporter permease [Jatrophihabitans sp.]
MNGVATYTRFELKRTFRNRRSFIFSLIFPVIMYFLIAAPNRHNKAFGESNGQLFPISAPQYYMVGLLSFGVMVAGLSTGARIAAERQVGWVRQLRLTPLSPRAYFRAKVATGYLMICIATALLYVSGTILGVRLPATEWVHMTYLVLIAAIPFAALGIGLGHLLTVDSMGPALGGGASLFAFLGGTWFPLTGHGAFIEFCQLLPSYWLVQAGHVGLGVHGDPWGAKGWIVVAAWSAAMIGLARLLYQRDTKRV